jgi:hypothetical protein
MNRIISYTSFISDYKYNDKYFPRAIYHPKTFATGPSFQ